MITIGSERVSALPVNFAHYLCVTWDYRALCARKLRALRLHCVGLICVRRRILHKALPSPSPAWLQPPWTLYRPTAPAQKNNAGNDVSRVVVGLPAFALATHSDGGDSPSPSPSVVGRVHRWPLGFPRALKRFRKTQTFATFTTHV